MMQPAMHAATIPAPSDNSTRFVANTIIMAISGGKIDTHVPIIFYSSISSG